MSKKPPIPRIQYPTRLAGHFYNDYKEIINLFDQALKEEIITHLIEVVDCIKAYNKTPTEEVYKVFSDKEFLLLKKHGKMLKPYSEMQFESYFRFDIVLAHKEILTNEEYNDLSEGQSLTADEVNKFCKICSNILYNELEIFYLTSPGTIGAMNISAPEVEAKDKYAIRARQLLAMYYLFKAAFNVQGYKTHQVTEIAKFIHLLIGTQYTAIANSQIYKMYLKMPNYKSDRLLIADLKFIRPYFVDLDMSKAVEMIDQEIKTCESQLNSGKK